MASTSDFRRLRGAVEAVVAEVDRDAAVVFEPARVPWAEAGAEIIAAGTAVGTAGIVSCGTREKFDLEQVEVAAAELDLEKLVSMQSARVQARPIPKYPAIDRDLSVVVDESVAWMDIERAICQTATGMLEKVSFVGIYRGGGVPSGSKSVTLSLRFRDETGTLKHEEADRMQARIVESLAGSVGAALRGP
jgi:phenylalanyl-tRNA synthetase beta chain